MSGELRLVTFDSDDPVVDPEKPEFDQLCFNLSIPPARRLVLHRRMHVLMAAVRRANQARGITPRWMKPPQPPDTSELDWLREDDRRFQLGEIDSPPSS
jgi:hypothetical protein